MPNLYETLEKNYIVYEKSKIHVLIDDDKIWFHLKDTILALGYRDHRNASKRLVNKKYTKKKISINTNNITGQPYSLYIND